MTAGIVLLAKIAQKIVLVFRLPRHFPERTLRPTLFHPTKEKKCRVFGGP